MKNEYAARKAALEIEKDCLDRRGIKNQFHGLDADIRKDIIDSWTKIIMKALAVAILALGVWGCGKPSGTYMDAPYEYRVHIEQHGRETYWMEDKPITFHGVCAHMYFGAASNVWVVENPYGLKKMADGRWGSNDVTIKTFPTQAQAVDFAESVCSTK